MSDKNQPQGYSNEAWEKLLESTIGKIKGLAASKGAEYSGDVDRLDNFRRQGAELGLPMEVIWGVYSQKHWDAVRTYIKDLNQGKTRPRSEPISGRVDDLLVYLLLFKAMLEEREETAEAAAVEYRVKIDSAPHTEHSHRWATAKDRDTAVSIQFCTLCGMAR